MTPWSDWPLILATICAIGATIVAVYVREEESQMVLSTSPMSNYDDYNSYDR